ncbi:hypothetical protein OG389_35080 [Streptomyces sp. NBC_00435]|uniref:hypothetical protein n=1 Tax=Streptomyces sp. NBC_00435 TaxID=2903649 RepID=UPI002E1A3736
MTASALVPLFVVAGLLLGPAATASAAAPVVRQAPAAATLSHGGLSAGAGVVTGVHAPTSSRAQATTGNKKGKKKSKKKGGFFKKLLIGVVIVIVLLVVLYGIRRAMRRGSA